MGTCTETGNVFHKEQYILLIPLGSPSLLCSLPLGHSFPGVDGSVSCFSSPANCDPSALGLLTQFIHPSLRGHCPAGPCLLQEEGVGGTGKGLVPILVMCTPLTSQSDGEGEGRTRAREPNSIGFMSAQCSLWEPRFTFLPLHTGVIETSLSCPSTMLELFQVCHPPVRKNGD